MLGFGCGWLWRGGCGGCVLRGYAKQREQEEGLLQAAEATVRAQVSREMEEEQAEGVELRILRRHVGESRDHLAAPGPALPPLPADVLAMPDVELGYVAIP